MQNDATTAISKTDMHKIIDISNHKPEVLDFANLAPEETNKKEETKKAAPAGKKGAAK